MSNITPNDLTLASAYFPLLVEVAKDRGLITYSMLVEQAKIAYPKNTVVQNAIPVSTGRRLDVVRLFTRERNYPDLTSLVVGKGSGECGVGFTRSFDPETVRKQVYEFDWSEVKTNFEGFLSTTEVKLKPRKRLKRKEALEAMFEYFASHRNDLPSEIRDYREYLLEAIEEGIDVADAFNDCIQRIEVEKSS